MDTRRYCWPTTIQAIQTTLSLRARAKEYGILFTADVLSATTVFVKGKLDLVIVDQELPCRHGSNWNAMIDGPHASNVVDGSETRKYLETGLRAGTSPCFKDP